MISKLEGKYHWVSISCMTTAMTMLTAGNTALEPSLQSSGALLSMTYWTFCSAFVVATAGFAYLALLSAQEQVRELEARAASPRAVESSARFNAVRKQPVEF